MICKGQPQGVGRTRPVELNIRQYGDVLITSVGDVFKTSEGDVPWRNIQDGMGTSEDVIFQRPKYVDRGHPQDVGRGRYKRTIWGHPQYIFWGTSTIDEGRIASLYFYTSFGFYNRFISPLVKKVRSGKEGPYPEALQVVFL